MFGRFSQFSFGNRRGMMAPSPLLIQGAPFRFEQRVLTNAELLALNATPITLFAAQPNTMYIPLLWGIRSLKPGAAAWTTSPTISLITEGITSPALTAANIPAALNTAAPIDTGLLLDDVQTSSLTTVSNRVNKALQVRSTVVPNQGAGSPATVRVFVAFVLWRMPLAG
ncbi:MAG TPA: hypothetical protein VJ842_14320 [Pyrinomonadaceae bacterium]|nr:hypothetical protein [Pyrinomonadaceae bacterium]